MLLSASAWTSAWWFCMEPLNPGQLRECISNCTGQFCSSLLWVSSECYQQWTCNGQEGLYPHSSLLCWKN